MKNVILFVSFFFTALSFAQDCYIDDFTEGTQWTIHSFNKKGKIEGISTQKIEKIEQVGDSVKFSVSGSATDEKGKDPMTVEFIMTCIGDVLHMDLSNMIPAESLEAMNGFEIEMQGNGMVYPNSLSVGSELPDASLEIKASTSGVSVMTMNILTTNRKVLSLETIQVGAGTFEAFKISETQKLKMSFVNKEYNEIQWYVPGIGVVKSETYDSKGNLEGSMEMVSYTKG